MIKHAIALGVLLVALAAPARAPAGDGLDLAADDLRDRPALCAVAEMQFIPEVDTWEDCRPGDFAEQAAAFREAWRKQAPWAMAHVTPALARALSRWARPQMEKYVAVPPADALAFEPVTAHKGRGMVVYKAKLDDLPTHAKIVTRRLELYVLYAAESKSIVRITVTIRGEVLE